MNRSRVAPILLLSIALAGCGVLSRKPVEQRTTEGLTAEAMFIYRVAQQNDREPNFEERQTWRDDIDRRISVYLRAHPEAANSYEVSKFRYLRQASVGMTREQIEILLGPPDTMTTEGTQIEKLARKYWPHIKDHTTEAWVYPLGWRFYFKDDRLVDITQYQE